MEGEIFGASMILASTIEKNYTIKSYPEFVQKSFTKNKLKYDSDQSYIILSDLMSEENKKQKNTVHNKDKLSTMPTVASALDDIGIQMLKTSKLSNSIYDRDISDSTVNDPYNKKHTVDFWNLVNHDENNSKLQTTKNVYEYEQSSSNTNDLPQISEFETPPPSKPINLSSAHTMLYSEKDLEFENPSVTVDTTKQPDKTVSRSLTPEEISEVEVPPSPYTDKNVYGQWTSSKYAGSVLNYLKSIKFHSKEKKVPQTIPLTKLSDHFPYASDLRVNIIRPPAQIQRKNLVVEKRFPTHYFHQRAPRQLRLLKRHAIYPEINIKVEENDVRDDILFAHAQTNPKNVEITHRSQTQNFVDNIYIDKHNRGTLRKEYPIQSNFNQTGSSNTDLYSTHSLLAVLPFLKSVEYFTEENEEDSGRRQELNNNNKLNNDFYTKTLTEEKWHNVMTYNDKYTPRNIKPRQNNDNIITIPSYNKKHVNIPLEYQSETNQLVKKKDPSIENGRALAMEVSNQSNINTETLSILKYNHGWLPGHEKKLKISKTKRPLRTLTNRNKFDKHIKIGNALNERDIIGTNDKQKKQSFEGGNANIPDIQKYRSDIDDTKDLDFIPSSLTPRICHNVELYDHILYVQPDDSIDVTHILSPLKIKNVGIQFVTTNYKSCSLDESQFEKNLLLLINWSRTPVRLFGGAHAMKTKDLCGFF